MTLVERVEFLEREMVKQSEELAELRRLYEATRTALHAIASQAAAAARGK